MINDNGCLYKYSGLLNEYVSEAKTGEITVTPKVDVNGRYMGRTVKYDNATVLDESVDYVKGADNRATNIPKQIQFGTNNVLSYDYDGHGNISAIKKNGEIIVSYRYDILDRLTVEHNKTLNKSIYYTYDNNGNITGKKETEYGDTQGTGTVRNYVYSNGRMISYNGEQCEYDAMGNPTTYRGKQLQWAYGRRLMNYDGNTFKYDAYGMRVGKNETVYLHDAKGRLRKQSDGLEFIYDNAGLLGLKYNGATYIYRKDVQGNVIAILDSSGNVVVEYTYDAWGNHTVSGSDTVLGNLNPFRYRGYYYDTETGLYYLQTRYYDPETGRFLNMDSIAYADPETINGLNLYAYCGNNPVMNVDPTGHVFWLIFLATVLFTAVGGTVLQAAASTLSYAGMAVASIFDPEIKQDMDNIGWNPFNVDENAVINSNKVSFYKGAPVFRTNGNRSGTFLGIFLTQHADADTVRHEYGHIVQQMTMGAGNYGLSVGIQSPLKLGPWNKAGNYFGAPWETMADIFGGVTGRVHTQEEITRAWLYQFTGMILGPATYLFLLWQ